MENKENESREERREILKDNLRPQWNKHYTIISFYVIMTCIILFILGKIGNNIGTILVGISSGLHVVGVILRPMLIGFVVAYLLFPAVGFLQRQYARLPLYKKKPEKARMPAIATTALIVFMAIVLLFSLLISALTHELTLVSFDGISGLVEDLSTSLRGVYTSLKEAMDNAHINSQALTDFANGFTTWVGDLATSVGVYLSQSVGNVTEIFANLGFSIIFAIYFLSDYQGLEKYWNKVLKAITGKRLNDGIHQVIADADQVFSGYIRGQMMDAALMAVIMSIALSLLNVKFAVIIGLLTGIGNLIPYVGPAVAYVLSAGVCLLNGDFEKAIIAVIIIFVITTIDGNVIEPKLLSSSIEVHPMLVIAALLLGGKIGGLMGMLCAVPVAALLKLWFDRGIERLIDVRTKRAESKGQEF